MSTKQLHEARIKLSAFHVSDRAYITTVYVGAFVGALTHLLTSIL